MISRHTSCLSSKALRSQCLNHRTPQAAFSTTSRRRGYDDTIQNLKIGSHTRVIFQGFTGKLATANAQESIAWGTNVVGGTNPKKDGQEHLGLPVVGSVRKAMEQLKPDATGIYVAAPQAAAAIEEAIEAEVPLIVAVAEHIPIHDVMRVSREEASPGHVLIDPDTLHAEDTIQISTCGRKRTRNHLSHRTLQDRIPASADILPRAHWRHRKIWHTIIRDSRIPHKSWCRTESVYWYGR